MKADTAVREAANILSWGGADFLERDLKASSGNPGDTSFRERLNTAKREQEVRRAYDREHRRGAVILGQGAGYALGVTGAAKGAMTFVGGLSNKGKGLVGEGLSALKTVAKGDLPVRFQTPVKLAAGGHTVIDHGTLFGKGIVEAKYRTGRPGRLTNAQRKAQVEYSDLYRVDQWGPKHVGRVAGGASVGAHSGSDAARSRRSGRSDK